MWNKIKSIALTIAIVAVSILAVILRSRSNGSGIQSDIDRAGRISDGVGELGESNSRIGAGLEELRENNNAALERTDDIRQDNIKASTGIQSAIDILKKAKERTDAQRS